MNDNVDEFHALTDSQWALLFILFLLSYVALAKTDAWFVYYKSSPGNDGSNFILKFRLQLIISYVRLIYSSSHLSCKQS
jgi:hypothetical protein